MKKLIALVSLLALTSVPLYAAGARDAVDRPPQRPATSSEPASGEVIEVAIAEVSYRNCLAAAHVGCGYGEVESIDWRGGFFGIGSSCSFTCSEE
ncbi:MAG: hypothetical protein AAF604_18970 [Acidobacteriota bacterium]